MKLARPASAVLLGIALLSIATGCTRSSSSGGARTATAAPLTRDAVVEIARGEIRHDFALRDWHSYAGYIDEYTGPDATSLYSLSVLDHATVTGNMDAPVRVIVYADYECPFCKAFETETAPVLQHKFGSQALFVYRFYPLGIHGKVAKAESLAGSACPD